MDFAPAVQSWNAMQAPFRGFLGLFGISGLRAIHVFNGRPVKTQRWLVGCEERIRIVTIPPSRDSFHQIVKHLKRGIYTPR